VPVVSCCARAGIACPIAIAMIATPMMKRIY
jgi:hypothetical protein